MTIAFEELDQELVTRFKNEVSSQGLSLSEALNQALEEWLEKYTKVITDDEMFWKNKELFEELLITLLPKHEKEWIVISEGEVIGFYPNREEALTDMWEKNLFGTGKRNILAPLKASQRKIRRIKRRRNEANEK